MQQHNEKEVVTKLTQFAKTSDCANAVFHVWAVRKRPRRTVTLSALARRMHKEGFKFSITRYAEVLSCMDALGLGKSVKDAKGRIRGLKDIPVTLQSLGAAACGGTPQLKNLSAPRRRFRVIALPPPETVTPNQQPVTAPRIVRGLTTVVGVTVELGKTGRQVRVTFPKETTSDELLLLLEKLA